MTNEQLCNIAGVSLPWAEKHCANTLERFTYWQRYPNCPPHLDGFLAELRSTLRAHTELAAIGMTERGPSPSDRTYTLEEITTTLGVSAEKVFEVLGKNEIDLYPLEKYERLVDWLRYEDEEYRSWLREGDDREFEELLLHRARTMSRAGDTH